MTFPFTKNLMSESREPALKDLPPSTAARAWIFRLLAALALCVAACPTPAATNSPSSVGSPSLSAGGEGRGEVAQSPSVYGLRSTVSGLPSSVGSQPSPASSPSSPVSSPLSSVSGLRSSVSGPPATITMSDLDDKHLLAIGDRLSFRIQEDLEDPQEPLEPKSLIVADSGEVEVPYIGRVYAENKTCKQIASEIKQLLEKDYYHQATVLISIDLRARTRGRVYLVGPVNRPGFQDLPSDETLTLSRAIMIAGGFTDYADRRNVKITRKGPGGEQDKQTFTVNVGEIFDKGKVERDIPLQSGDMITIPERGIRF